MIDALRAAALKVANLRKRDKREPGRKEKELSELRVNVIIKRVFRKQRERLRQWLELYAPDAKVLRSLPPLPADFWAWDEEDQWDFALALQESRVAGADLLLEQIAVGIDPTSINTRARSRAQSYAGDLIKDINATTQQAVKDTIARFTETPGMTIGDVVRQLPFDEQRALTVAVTEITRAYADGAKDAGEELAKKYPDVRIIKTWFTNDDDRVCPICGPLDNKSIDFDNTFDEGLDAPPAHPNCRCWMQSSTDIRGGA
jgi:hypothetical protein